MELLKLLSRSAKFKNTDRSNVPRQTPSSGQNATTKGTRNNGSETGDETPTSLKRKRRDRLQDNSDFHENDLDFFSAPIAEAGASRRRKRRKVDDELHTNGASGALDLQSKRMAGQHAMSSEDRRRIMKEHKVKVTWLNPSIAKTKARRKEMTKVAKVTVIPQPLEDFSEMELRFGITNALATQISDRGYTSPTEVQLAALPLLLDEFSCFTIEPSQETGVLPVESYSRNLLTIAPTGSGKTVAFLLPLIHKIQTKRSTDVESRRHTSALILAPTKELVAQIVNEGRKLVSHSRTKITQLRKGMKLAEHSTDQNDKSDQTDETHVSADILVATPGLMQSIVTPSEEATGRDILKGVRWLVLDEADVLLDPLFREQTLSVWNSLSNPELSVSLWSATMGSNIEEVTQQTIFDRQKRLQNENPDLVPQAPLLRLVVGLKDSAIPTVQHRLVYAATEQGKLMSLRQLLHPTTTSGEAGPSIRPPFLIFTQTIERAIALHSELLYDIPAEAGGIRRIAVLHSDLSDNARDSIMTRFRKGEIWVLITTDLLSRGVDFQGINGVVNYDLPTSSAAYVHRVGRTGRAGREGGVAVTLYSEEDVPYLKHVATVVSMAQTQSGDENGIQQWLLDALPKLGKNERQKLKKRGIKSRTASARQTDPKASRKARISTKAGYMRREENKRKAAVHGRQRHAEHATNGDSSDDSGFDGFD